MQAPIPKLPPSLSLSQHVPLVTRAAKMRGVLQVEDAPPESPHALTPKDVRRFTHSASSECLTI